MTPTPRIPELLAPAGSLDALHAALKNGADAVYLGAQAFGARATAGFSPEQLAQAVDTAHLYRKKIYVTLNTLIKPNEMQDVLALAQRLNAMGVDALIVQDLGLLRALRRDCPTLPLHASTQMSIHNAAGAVFASSLGISRVVLARECSASTIKKMTNTGIECEVFVHGALCVSVSGQCLLSSQIGGRSGNRGRCAQPCRLMYHYRDQEGAWLSPRDLSQLSQVPELVDAGVHSFKIEGRLKNAEYVAIAVAAYRHAIDCAANHEENTRLEEDQHRLLQVFSRGGFTQGLRKGRDEPRYINPLRVSHEGLPLGTVLNTQEKGSIFLSDIQLTTPLYNGDHLQFRGSNEQEMIYSGTPLGAGDKATLRHYRPTRPGTMVYKLLDAMLMADAQKSFEADYPPIPLAATLRLEPGSPSRLTLKDPEGTQCQVEGAVCAKAAAQPLTKDNTRTSMHKRGQSPFAITDYQFESTQPAFLPVAALNALRRDALDAMRAARLAAYVRAAGTGTVGGGLLPRRDVVRGKALFVKCQHMAWREALIASGATHFLYAPQDYTSSSLADELAQLSPQDYFVLPRQAEDDTLVQLHRLVWQAGVGVMVDNVAQLGMQWPAGVIAGDGIPAWNGETAAFLQDAGCTDMVLSPELTLPEMESLLDTPGTAPVVRVYGRVIAMLLNHCPERTFRGLSGSQTMCGLCRSGDGTLNGLLVDSHGARYPLFPVRLPEGCLNQMMFHTPLHLSKRAPGTRWLIDLLDEDLAQAKATVAYYAALRRNERVLPPLQIPYYTGRLVEGVQ